MILKIEGMGASLWKAYIGSPIELPQGNAKIGTPPAIYREVSFEIQHGEIYVSGTWLLLQTSENVLAFEDETCFRVLYASSDASPGDLDFQTLYNDALPTCVVVGKRLSTPMNFGTIQIADPLGNLLTAEMLNRHEQPTNISWHKGHPILFYGKAATQDAVLASPTLWFVTLETPIQRVMEGIVNPVHLFDLNAVRFSKNFVKNISKFYRKLGADEEGDSNVWRRGDLFQP